MANNTPPFNAQERDIDILLLEEMHCNSAFVSWIAGRVGIEGATLVSAEHSVYKGNGETDVLAVIDCARGRIALMIEDKIGAAMQPEQAERYHLRGEQLCATQPVIKYYKTLLCAPRAYIALVPEADWHATLPLEEIADWFAKQNNLRSEWRRNILMHAVRRQRRSSAVGLGEISSATDPTLVNFKRDYQEHIAKNYPEFRAPVQPGKDKEFYFKGVNFPTYIALKHRFIQSQMVLMFEKQWSEKAGSILPRNISNENMWITHHPLSLHLVVGVEPIALTEPFAKQTDLVNLAIEAARRLLPYASMVQKGPAEQISN